MEGAVRPIFFVVRAPTRSVTGFGDSRPKHSRPSSVPSRRGRPGNLGSEPGELAKPVSCSGSNPTSEFSNGFCKKSVTTDPAFWEKVSREGVSALGIRKKYLEKITQPMAEERLKLVFLHFCKSLW